MGDVKLLKGLHAKVYIIDDKCILTSANLTETAFFKRYEIGVLLEGAEAKEVIDIYKKWWDIGESINSDLGKELINQALLNQDSISDQLPMLWNLPIDLDCFES
jgi:phosphatidylserine/phosphatidylglycerophosphate/cardiolipin synthase-like enzyme